MLRPNARARQVEALLLIKVAIQNDGQFGGAIREAHMRRYYGLVRFGNLGSVLGWQMADSAFFRPELFQFLRQLRRHNDRDWFAKNKARYHEAVPEPALLFIGSFGPHLAKISPFFVADPRPARGSLFQI